MVISDYFAAGIESAKNLTISVFLMAWSSAPILDLCIYSSRNLGLHLLKKSNLDPFQYVDPSKKTGSLPGLSPELSQIFSMRIEIKIMEADEQTLIYWSIGHLERCNSTLKKVYLPLSIHLGLLRCLLKFVLRLSPVFWSGRFSK